MSYNQCKECMIPISGKTLCKNCKIKNRPLFNVVELSDYIQDHFNGNQKAFADAQGVLPQQVTKWLNGNFIVVNNKLYSERRKLNN